MASHCSPETSSTVSVDRPEQDVGVRVAYCDDDDETVRGEKSILCLRPKTCWIGAVVIFVVAGIVTIAAVALGAMGSGGSQEGSSEAPHESEAFYQERLAVFRPFVGRWSETSTLVQTDTPQAQALDWLVYQDRTVSHTAIDETALKQRYAVMVLYFACGGEGWQSFAEGTLEMQGATPTCEWVGDRFIECDPGSKEVTLLDLSNRRMTGLLPDEVGLLTSLEILSVPFNFLEGTIPESYFDTLRNLKVMIFNTNEFVGSLSSKVGQLSQLEVLSVGGNYLTGTLPQELGQLERLQELFLQDNEVEGPFFDMFGTSWPDLRILVLDDTLLSGTISDNLGSWNLQELSLNNPQFKGPFPSPAVELLSDLVYFNVGSTELTGTIPDFTQLTKLKQFVFEGKGFTGPIPTSVGLLTDLEYFFIRDTSLSGTIPSELGNCRNLEELTLTEGTLTGTMPSELGNLDKLILINVVDMRGLNGTFPETMCDRAGSGVLRVLRHCVLTCDCCVDTCHSTNPIKNNGQN